jgi:hypothetical protein
LRKGATFAKRIAPALESIEISTAAEAVAKAWSVMGAGATGLYIYDNDTYEAYFPDEFMRLFKMTAAVTH